MNTSNSHQTMNRAPIELGADLEDDEYPAKITNLTAKRHSKGYHIEFELLIEIQKEERVVYKQHNVCSPTSLELLSDDLKKTNFTLFTPLELVIYGKTLIDKDVVVRKKTKGDYINWYFVRCDEEYRAELIYRQNNAGKSREEEMAPDEFVLEKEVPLIAYDWSFS